MTKDRDDIARETIARFLWNMAARETGTRHWDEIKEHHPMRRRYLQAAAIIIAMMPFVIGGEGQFAPRDEDAAQAETPRRKH